MTRDELLAKRRGKTILQAAEVEASPTKTSRAESLAKARAVAAAKRGAKPKAKE